MDTKHLYELSVIVRTGSYSAAAKELFTSQPALSRRVKTMEAELGFPLVVHGLQPVTLTKEGEYFLAKATSLFDQFDELVRQCRDSFDQSIAAVKVANIVYETKCAQMLCRFIQKSGIAALSLISKESVLGLDEFEALDEGIVDFSFTFAPTDVVSWFADVDCDTYEFIKLGREPLAIVIPASPGDEKDGSIGLRELDARELVFVSTTFFLRCERAILATIRRLGITAPAIFGCDKSQREILALNGNHAALMFYEAVKDNRNPFTVVKSLVGHRLSLDCYAICRKGNPNASVQAIAAALTNHLAIGDTDETSS